MQWMIHAQSILLVWDCRPLENLVHNPFYTHQAWVRKNSIMFVFLRIQSSKPISVYSTCRYSLPPPFLQINVEFFVWVYTLSNAL